MQDEFPTAGEGAHTPRGRPIALSLRDLFVMVLCKARQGTPYYALAHQFGIHNGPAHRLCIQFRNLFNATAGKRLFHLQDADIVRAHLPDDWPARFRDTLLIGDAIQRPSRKAAYSSSSELRGARTSTEMSSSG